MAQLLITAAINIAVGLLLSFLFGPEGGSGSEGPRLDDLTVSSSAYGKNRNLGYGTARLNGNIIWSDGVEEVITIKEIEVPGSIPFTTGTIEQTVYTYFSSFALALAEGEASEILRIWGDNKLIFDRTGQGNTTSKYSIRFYKGEADQTPDPLMSADVDGKHGAGSTPAYNGVVYFVANRWPLADFGNHIPNITVELAFKSNDTLPFVSLVELPGHNVPGSIAGGSSGFGMLLDPFTNFLYFLKPDVDGMGVADAFAMTDLNLMVSPSSLGSTSAMVGLKSGVMFGQEGGANFAAIRAYDVFSGTLLGESGFTVGNGVWIAVLESEFPGTLIDSQTWVIISRKSILDDGAFTWVRMLGPGSFHNGISDVTPRTRGLSGGPAISNWFANEAYVIMENNTDIEITRFRVSRTQIAEIEGVIIGSGSHMSVVRVLTATKASLGFSAEPIEGWILLPNENAIILGSGIPDSGAMVKFDLEDWSVMASTQLHGTAAANNWATHGVWMTVKDSGANNGAYYIFDTDTLELIETVDPEPIFATGVQWAAHRSCVFDPRSDSITFSRVFGSNPSSDRVVKVFLDRASGVGETLSSVVTDLCARAGLSADDIDVTSLVAAGDIVDGYAITRPGSFRAAIEPLQKAFLFDGVESDWKLKFIKRGGAPVLTIAEDDLGRLGDSEQIEERRVQEIELPERVIVGYSNRERDYEPGTSMYKRVALPSPSQYSRSELKLDFPIVLTATAARQIAAKAMFTVWAERVTVDSTLPWKYIRLDPTDITNMIFRGETRQIRLGEIEVGADLSLDFTAVQEDISTYDSSITGTGGDGFVPQIAFGGLPSKLIPMNLPLILEFDATGGASNRIYYALSGYEDNWPGATVYRSTDAGSIYSVVSGNTVEAAWGVISAPPPDLWTINGLAFERKPAGEGGFTWDDENTIEVKILNEGAKWVSSTDLEVLNGANYAAIIKADRTVELFQFVTVTSIDAGTILLSRLLRGRRGTEDYGNDHLAGSIVVLLETGTYTSWRSPLDLISISTLYTAVTFATLIESAPKQIFLSNGEDLRPYSVVNVSSNRAGGDLTINWDRRTRHNGQLIDGTGEVPINEVTEEYEIDYYLQGTVEPFLSRVGLTTTTDILTSSEFTAIVPIGVDQLLFTNWDFERQVTVGDFPEGYQTVLPDDGNWRVESGAVGSITGPPGGGGSNYAVITTDNTTTDLAVFVLTKKWSFVDDFFQTEDFMDDSPTIDLDIQTSNPTVSDHGTQVDLRIYDKDDNIIQTISSGRITGTPGTWINTTVLATTVVAGARTFDILVTADNNSGLSTEDCTGAVDQILVELNGIGTVIPAIDVKIYQISGISQIGRGKSTRQRV